MKKNKRELDSKIKKYLDQLFSGVGATQELFELKEELATNLKEKIADYESRGMNRDEAFKEAVISMGDLSGLVEDMRKLGQEQAKKSVYTSMTSRISTAGIVVGVLLILFGLLTTASLFFMGLDLVGTTGPLVFVVLGGAIVTYSYLTRETSTKYAMGKARAIYYALAIGIILFSLYVALASGTATGEMFIAISSFMVFFLVGVGLFLTLLLTGTDRRKRNE